MIAATGKVGGISHGQTNVSLATEGEGSHVTTWIIGSRRRSVYEDGEKRPEKKANVILTDNIIPAGERDQVMSRVYNAKRGDIQQGDRSQQDRFLREQPAYI